MGTQINTSNSKPNFGTSFCSCSSNESTVSTDIFDTDTSSDTASRTDTGTDTDVDADPEALQVLSEQSFNGWAVSEPACSD